MSLFAKKLCIQRDASTPQRKLEYPSAGFWVDSKLELDELERHFIRVLKTQHPDVGYNICAGGEGFTGPHSEEWRRETLKRVQEYWSDPAARERRAQNTRERWASNPGFRKNHQDWCRTNPNKLAYWRGKKKSEESKRKCSQSMRGKQNTLGHRLTEEHKRKIGQAGFKGGQHAAQKRYRENSFLKTVAW
jgi:hypothetical protein